MAYIDCNDASDLEILETWNRLCSVWLWFVISYTLLLGAHTSKWKQTIAAGCSSFGGCKDCGFIVNGCVCHTSHAKHGDHSCYILLMLCCFMWFQLDPQSLFLLGHIREALGAGHDQHRVGPVAVHMILDVMKGN